MHIIQPHYHAIARAQDYEHGDVWRRGGVRTCVLGWI